MGEAKASKKMYDQWFSTLDAESKILAGIASKLYEILPEGSCYWATFFLKYHLAFKYNLAGNAVVGFVNDGTDYIYSSHAWFVRNNKITDVALCRPLQPEIQQAGNLLINGHLIKSGWSGWTYHLERPIEGTEQIHRMKSIHSQRDFVLQCEELHKTMLEISKSTSLMRQYLDNAPHGMNYKVLAELCD